LYNNVEILLFKNKVVQVKTIIPVVKPGEAAAKLLALRKKAVSKKRKYPVSENIKKHLYILKRHE
jgi:hypothetical protein